jgi:hypothetical protein
MKAQKASKASRFSRNIRVPDSLQCAQSSEGLKLGLDRTGYLQAVPLGEVQRGAPTWTVPNIIGGLDTTAVRHFSEMSDRRNDEAGRTMVEAVWFGWIGVWIHGWAFTGPSVAS